MPIANVRNFSEMFGYDFLQYIVPTFQRSYVWESKELREFWSGIEAISMNNMQDQYFLGTVIIMDTDSTSLHAVSKLIIDGQQRLLTIFLALLALEKAAREMPSLFLDFKYHLQIPMSSRSLWSEEQPKLLLSAADRDIFWSLIKGERPSKSRITTAFNYFYNQFKGVCQKERDYLRYEEIITTKLTMVVIELQQDEDPYPIFATINRSGLPLTLRKTIRSPLNKRKATVMSRVRQITNEQELNFLEQQLESYQRFSQDPELMSIISAGETEQTEFKEAAGRNPFSGDFDAKIREKIVIAVAAMMNGKNGGNVIIGISDNGEIKGIDIEYPIVNKSKSNWDGYLLFLADVLNKNLSISNAFQHYSISKHVIDGRDICRIRVTPAPAATFYNKKLYVRSGNQSLELQGPDLLNYVRERWKKHEN